MTTGRRGWFRPAFYGASVALVLWAAMAVPLPFVEYLPGTPQAVAPLVSLDPSNDDGAALPDNDRELHTSMLTVVVRQQASWQAVGAWLDDQRRLLPASQVLPVGIDRSEYRRQQRERFSRQFEVAAAVGARAAGYEADLRTEVVVMDVVPGAPAEGILSPGDVIRAVDQVEIRAAEELQSIAFNGAVGDELHLTIESGGRTRQAVVRLGRLPGADGPRLGITIQTAVDAIDLPFGLRLADDVRIGGPSAGLIVGLTVYGMLADGAPLEGIEIAATGSLDADGSVGRVGGVPEKVRAALAHGVDLVMVPADQLDEALAVRGADRQVVVGVSSLDEAIEHVRSWQARHR